MKHNVGNSSLQVNLAVNTALIKWTLLIYANNINYFRQRYVNNLVANVDRFSILGRFCVCSHILDWLYGYNLDNIN